MPCGADGKQAAKAALPAEAQLPEEPPLRSLSEVAAPAKWTKKGQKIFKNLADMYQKCIYIYIHIYINRQ